MARDPPPARNPPEDARTPLSSLNCCRHAAALLPPCCRPVHAAAPLRPLLRALHNKRRRNPPRRLMVSGRPWPPGKNVPAKRAPPTMSISMASRTSRTRARARTATAAHMPAARSTDRQRISPARQSRVHDGQARAFLPWPARRPSCEFAEHVDVVGVANDQACGLRRLHRFDASRHGSAGGIRHPGGQADNPNITNKLGQI